MPYLSYTCLIMSDQAAPFQDLQPDSTEGTLTTQTCKVNSFEEVEAVIKLAIWNRCSGSETLFAINIEKNKSESSGYEVKLIYDSLDSGSSKEIVPKHMLRHQGFEDYKPANTCPLHQNHDNIVQVKVLEASHSVFPFPAVIKLYHCGFFNINSLIQEALIQVKLTSAYTCKLLDLFIHEISNHSFEVGLVMERLEGDLETDIKNRSALNNWYT